MRVPTDKAWGVAFTQLKIHTDSNLSYFKFYNSTCSYTVFPIIVILSQAWCEAYKSHDDKEQIDGGWGMMKNQ